MDSGLFSLHFEDSQDQKKATFQHTAAVLNSTKWTELHFGSADFNELQIDIVFHAVDKPRPVFGKNLIRLSLPKASRKIIKTKRSFKKLGRSISDEALAEDPNCVLDSYIVFEATANSNIVLSEKLPQLERDLTFLLERQKLRSGNERLTVGNIVSLAGVACTHLNTDAIQKFICEQSAALPLITELLAGNRFYYFKGPARPKSTLCDMISENSSSHSDTLEMKSLRIDILKQNKLKAASEARKAASEEEIQRRKAEIDMLEKKIAYWKTWGNSEKVQFFTAALDTLMQ
jgi:hypothetical protein